MITAKRKVIITANVCICAAILYFATSHKETSLSSESATADTASSTDVKGSGQGPVGTGSASMSAASASATGAGGGSVRHTASLAKPKAFEVSAEQKQTLAGYAKIRHKVFLTEADKKEKARLLRDRAFLQSLAPIVTASTAGNNDGGETQNDALDLLYDALNAEGKDAAAGVLGQVVQDNQVENKDLPAKDRENLAGVKAEALYEWTARDPGAAAKVSAMLPGSVSQQLWQNVQSRQDRNLASSSTENSKSK